MKGSELAMDSCFHNTHKHTFHANCFRMAFANHILTWLLRASSSWLTPGIKLLLLLLLLMLLPLLCLGCCCFYCHYDNWCLCICFCYHNCHLQQYPWYYCLLLIQLKMTPCELMQFIAKLSYLCGYYAVDIKNNAWVTVNNDFWSRVKWFANDFHQRRNHEWKSLATHIRSDQKSLFTVTNYYFISYALFFSEHTIPLKAIIDRSFCHCHQERSSLTLHCDVTTIDFWRHAN